MNFPFMGMIWLAKYLDARQFSDPSMPAKRTVSIPLFHPNAQQKNLLKSGGLFLVMIASFILVEKLAYHTDNWSSFRSYSAARASIYDYEGYPDYDAHETLYRELGISRSSYEGAAHRYSLLLEPAINRHSMEVLESVSAQSRHISSGQLSDKLQKMAAFFCERHLSDADKPLNLLVYRCYLLFVICALLSGNRRALRDILFILFARMVVWSYLVYHGRLPIRVSQAVYLAELVILLAIAFGNRIWTASETDDANEVKKTGISRRSARYAGPFPLCSLLLSVCALVFRKRRPQPGRLPHALRFLSLLRI